MHPIYSCCYDGIAYCSIFAVLLQLLQDFLQKLLQDLSGVSKINERVVMSWQELKR
jgi:hypothetical protein